MVLILAGFPSPFSTGGHFRWLVGWLFRRVPRPLFFAVCVLSPARLSGTPLTAAHQAPLSMGFPRQECWSGVPFPPPADLPDPGIEPASLVTHTSAGGFFTTAPPGKPKSGSRIFVCWSCPHTGKCKRRFSDLHWPNFRKPGIERATLILSAVSRDFHGCSSSAKGSSRKIY